MQQSTGNDKVVKNNEYAGSYLIFGTFAKSEKTLKAMKPEQDPLEQQIRSKIKINKKIAT